MAITSKSEHTMTYKIPIIGGKGELLNNDSPKARGFFDRMVLYSLDMEAKDIDRSSFGFKHESSDIFTDKTAALFFRKTEYMSTKECGFELDFDVIAKGSQFDLTFSSNNSMLNGTICVVIFYRDSPYPNPRIL